MATVPAEFSKFLLPRTATTGRVAAQHAALLLQIVTALFVGSALVLMLSASSVISTAQYGSGLALFERQVFWTVLGSVGFFYFSRVDLNRVRRCSIVLIVLVLGALVFVQVAGKSAGGSSRWIGVSFIRFQPTEFAKLGFAIFAADFIACRERSRHVLASLVLPLGSVFAFMAILVLAQPDLGSTIMLALIFFVLLFGAGIDGRIFLWVFSSTVFFSTVYALAAPYRRQRLLSFLSPFHHESTSGYQLVQSLLALGSGHLTGTGFGSSSATWGFLPNAQTDFIYAVIGNQYGYIGALLVIVGFLVFGACGMRIARNASDRFSSLLVLAITTWIVAQAVINIGGVISVMPETGIPLPFLSFGGSSLIAVLAGVGLIVNVARHSATKTKPNELAQRTMTGIFGRVFQPAPPRAR